VIHIHVMTGLVAHMPVPVLPNNIVWYWPKRGDALWLGLAESTDCLSVFL